METTPESSLQAITSMLRRTPMSEAEVIGIQCCVTSLDKALKELSEIKSTKEQPNPSSP